jgi:hypothetical protein
MKNTLLFLLFIIFPVILFSQGEQIKIDGSQKVIKIAPDRSGIKSEKQNNFISVQKSIQPEDKTLSIPANRTAIMIKQPVDNINNSGKILDNIDLKLYQGTGYSLTLSSQTVKQGGTFTASLSVGNYGAVAAGSFKVAIFLSTDINLTSADYNVGETTIQSLNASSYLTVQVDCTVPTTVPAASGYYVLIAIDAYNAIAETDETNNIWYYPNRMTIESATTDINLAFYSGTGAINYYDPHTLTPGGTFTSYIAIQNNGKVSSGEFKVSVGISADQIYHLTDPEVGYLTVTNIDAGYYRNLTINCTVPSTQAAGQYYIVIYLDDSYQITETDETDNSNYYSDLATVVTDVTPPTIIHTAVTSATYNTAIPVYASATDASGVLSLYLLYGKSNETSWDPNNKVNFSGGLATIPASAVTENGIDYAIWAVDNIGNKGYWQNAADGNLNYTSVPVSVPANKITGYNTKGGKEYTSYELFSAPFNFGTNTASALLKSLGTYKKNWRVMNLTSSNAFSDGESASLDPAKSIFLITDKSYTISAPAAGTTSKMSSYFGNGVTLSAGWSLLGNPFPYQIPITYMYFYNSSTLTYTNPDAWSYNGTAGWVKAANLDPWKGIAVYTAASQPLKFRLGWTPAVGAAAPEQRSAISENLPNQVFQKSETMLKNSGQNWFVKVSVKGEKMWDQENYFGMQEIALAGKDNYDKVEPPILEDGIAAYFPHLDWKEDPNLYHCDIQPVNNDGASWNFVIKAQPDENINLEFKGLENIPAGFNKYLFDLDHKTSYNLGNSENVKITGGKGNRNLLIVIGKSSYISAKSDNIKLSPDNFALNQNYPNPFNPSTVISYSLPYRSNVKLTILDITGRTVKTLINEEKNEGFYEIAFNASDLSSGVYYYRLQATGIKSFTEMKKMILVK